MEQLPLPDGTKAITNCSKCHETCHDSCVYIRDEDKIHCSAMSNGKCRICKNKCPWNEHYHNHFMYKPKVVTEKCTYHDLKERYEKAQGKKWNLRI